MGRQSEPFVVGASEPCFFLKPPPKVDTSLRNSIGGDFYLSVGLMEFQWFRRQNDMHFSSWKRESWVGLMEFQWFRRQNDMHFSCWKRESSVWPTVCFFLGPLFEATPQRYGVILGSLFKNHGLASAPCFFLKPPPKVDTSLRNSIGGDFYLKLHALF